MHHCSKHRPQPRHRRTTLGDHICRLTALAALLGAAVGLLYAVPEPADANQSSPAVTVKRVTDYGSGLWGGPTAGVVRTGDPATANYLLLGDSIGSRCTPDIATLLASKGKTVATITQSGQDAQGLIDLLLAEPELPGTIIAEVGTNNVFQPPTMLAQVSRLKNWAADHGKELYWGDTYVGRPTTAAADARNSGWVNSFIYAEIPFDHVLGWQPALAAAVGRGRALSYYLQDGVHPWKDASTVVPTHGDGCAFLAAVYVAGLGL